MIIKALKTFSDGAISMHEGEIANVPDAKAQLFIAEGYAIEYTGEGGEIDLSNYVTKDTAQYYGESAVGFGTSITQLCADYTNGGYLGVVKSKLGLVSYDNKGLSGNPIAHGTGNGNGIGALIESTNLSDYDIITIEGGTNDFKLNVEIGTISAMGSNFNKDTTVGALQSAIEYIFRNKPTAKILVILDPQRNNANYDIYYTNSAGYKLKDYLNAIQNVAMLYGIPVCDWYSTSGINNLSMSTFLEDGLHPNAIGYERLGELVVNALIGNTIALGVSEGPIIPPTPSNIITIDGVDYDISGISGYTYKMIMSLSNKLYLYMSNSPFKMDDTSKAEMVTNDTLRCTARRDNTFNSSDGISVTDSMTLVSDGYYKLNTSRTLSQYKWTSHDILYFTSGEVAVSSN
jgi:lysophospholipase L1-like esterase